MAENRRRRKRYGDKAKPYMYVIPTSTGPTAENKTDPFFDNAEGMSAFVATAPKIIQDTMDEYTRKVMGKYLNVRI